MTPRTEAEIERAHLLCCSVLESRGPKSQDYVATLISLGLTMGQLIERGECTAVECTGLIEALDAEPGPLIRVVKKHFPR